MGRHSPVAFEDMSAAERAMDDLLERSHFAAQHELPQLIAEQAKAIGFAEATTYLADLQQSVLVSFAPPSAEEREKQPLAIDGTLAGRAFQHMQVLSQGLGDERVRLWVPMVDGTERLGVLSVVLPPAEAEEVPDGTTGIRLRRFAALISELIVTKTMYGDTIVRLRRLSPMDLAAELQWSLLPPMTCATADVTIAGALEPAYEIAGDTLDYAVDRNIARAAVFDGMGHGLRSSQLATVAIAAYRNWRRANADLASTATGIHDGMVAAFDGTQFTTAVLVELASDTGVLRWTNAGHPPPLLLRDGRLVRRLTCRPTPPLGVVVPDDVQRTTPQVCQEQLERGDRVLLYSDGVLEARSPEGEFFGEQRLLDLLGRHFAAGLPAPETMRRVVRALLEHQQGRLTDDATMLLLEWHTDVTAMRY